MRLPLPLWAYSGAAPQDPRKKDQKRAVEPQAVLAEVRRAGGVRYCHPPVVCIYRRLSPARLLQIYLSRRYPGGWYSPDGPAGGVSLPGRVALHLEDRSVRRDFAAVCILLPGLLPLPVPSGGYLLPLQPGGPAGLPGGCGQVRRLRPVYPHVPDGRGPRGRPGVHPVRPVPPYLPQRGHLFWLGKESNP